MCLVDLTCFAKIQCNLLHDYISMLYAYRLLQSQCNYNNFILWPLTNPNINDKLKKHSMPLLSKRQFQTKHNVARSSSSVNLKYNFLGSIWCGLVLKYTFFLLRFSSVWPSYDLRTSNYINSKRTQSSLSLYVFVTSGIIMCVYSSQYLRKLC